MDIFVTLGIIITITIIISGIMFLLRQPLIIAYILSGIIAGPIVLNLIDSTEVLQAFSHIGIAILLFMVGIGLDVREIKGVGRISAITGLGQIIFTSTLGYFISLALGYSMIASVYISVALTFSSTIIIFKLLTDKGDTKSLYGRIAIGFLLVQDLVAVIILLIIPSLAADLKITELLVYSGVKLALLLIIVYLFSKFALSKLTEISAKSQEFFLLFSIGWCLLLASMFFIFGFSIEIGALIAGLSLSGSPFRYKISSNMRPLRDFFLVIFFILLGAQMVIGDVRTQLIPIIIFSLFILIGNPLIVIILMGVMGHHRRTGFLAGLTVAQISEFSLILIALGVSVGHLEQSVMSLVTVVGLLTIALSSYMIIYSKKIYPLVSKPLKIFEKKRTIMEEYGRNKEKKHDIIFFGFDKIYEPFLDKVRKGGKSLMVIDFNPETIKYLAKKEYECRYGDIFDYELLDSVNIKSAKMIISIYDDISYNTHLINEVGKYGPDCVKIVTSHSGDDALKLYSSGATYVITPEHLAGSLLSYLFKKYTFDAKQYESEKKKQMKLLRLKK